MLRYLVIMACGLAIGSVILTFQTQQQIQQQLNVLQTHIQQSQNAQPSPQILEHSLNLNWAAGVKKATHSVVSITAIGANISGSGIILDTEGLIATNAHVVETAITDNQAFQVILADGRHYPAEIIAVSTRLDVALLLIKASSLQAIQLAEQIPLLGEPVFAIGNPLNIGQTASMGIISGFKKFSYLQQAASEYIQTDAIIHPGSSGGALVNQFGEMVGMNSLFLADQQHIGISFVIPIQSVFSEMSQLLNQSDLSHSHYLGISVMRVMNHARFNHKFIVSHVTQGSPADKLGFKMGDIFNQPFIDEKALRKALKADAVDNIIRNEQEMDI